ncbi:MAG: alpha-isopropylmalate synthase regulatory domain-containing protein [Gaiellales bacterium]
MNASSNDPAATADQRIHLARWSCTTGSNVQSRGVVVVESGEHRWEATAEGNGAVDALFGAVDGALHEVLTGHPRLLSYEVKALAEGPDAEGSVTVRIAPPSAARGARAEGTYSGEGRSANIIAASVEAYIEAINELLAEVHWAGAAEAAGSRRKRGDKATQPGAEFDEDAAPHMTTDWFER